MAHYAVIQDGVVESVFVGVDEWEVRGDIGGSTEAWEEYYQTRPWNEGKLVKRCSYSGSFRKNYPGPGFAWDESKNAFIPPKPYPSWILNETTCRWESPVAMPDTGGPYQWNEEEQTWDEIV